MVKHIIFLIFLILPSVIQAQHRFGLQLAERRMDHFQNDGFVPIVGNKRYISAFQYEYFFAKKWSAFSSFKYSNKKGNTAIWCTSGGPDYVRLHIANVQAGIFYNFLKRKLTPRFGLAAVYQNILLEQKYLDLPIYNAELRKSSLGFNLQAALAYQFHKKVSFQIGTDYSCIASLGKTFNSDNSASISASSIMLQYKF
jgi:hypothetical protein